MVGLENLVISDEVVTLVTVAFGVLFQRRHIRQVVENSHGVWERIRKLAEKPIDNRHSLRKTGRLTQDLTKMHDDCRIKFVSGEESHQR